MSYKNSLIEQLARNGAGRPQGDQVSIQTEFITPQVLV